MQQGFAPTKKLHCQVATFAQACARHARAACDTRPCGTRLVQTEARGLRRLAHPVRPWHAGGTRQLLPHATGCIRKPGCRCASTTSVVAALTEGRVLPGPTAHCRA